MVKEKILIAVKTYPTLSEKYIELACTAGFREDGTWIRLYPIPFRLLENGHKYSKYQWVEVYITKNKGDQRPESYRVLNTNNIRLLDKIGTEREWEARRNLVLKNKTIHTNLTKVIELARNNALSLAIFKPTEILDLVVEAVDPEWCPDKIYRILEGFKQGHLFEEQNFDDFKIMPKLPYKFSYRFKDDEGKESKLMIEDWEIGQLYWNCAKNEGKHTAIQKIKQKYINDFANTKDLHLFLGTTYEWHVRRSRNPFVIIGTFHPPHARQKSLF